MVKCIRANRKIDFDGWAGLFVAGTRATDEFGNNYRSHANILLSNMIATEWEHRGNRGFSMGSGVVYPDKPRAELLTFDRPVPTATYLDIDLDAKAIGRRGTILFRVPKGMWAKKEKK